MKTLKWAAKISPNKLVMLYKNYIASNVDEADVDNVGLGLYLRCRDIILILNRTCSCPECGMEIHIQDGLNRCANPDCEFMITKEEYQKSWRHTDLWCGKALPCFEEFYLEYPRAKGINQKMILIDTLIHSFHWDLKANLPNRAAGNNLIEGSLKQVVAILDDLSGIQPDNDIQFKQTAQDMWRRRKGY